MVGWLVNNEVKSMWKEAVIAEFEAISSQLPRGRGKLRKPQNINFLGRDLNRGPQNTNHKG